MAISWHVTSRLKPVLFATELIWSEVRVFRVIGVSSTPGNTALTNIPLAARSIAVDWTRPFKADLVIEYESLLGRMASCHIDETMHRRAPLATFS